MPKLIYKDWKPGPTALSIVSQAETICADYQAQGYDLTLRQLYYQFVSRGLIPNNQAEYNRLGETISKARLAGLLDWDYIVDRTRNLAGLSHWETPGGVIRSARHSYNVDRWKGQPNRVEVWVEKEALAGIVGQAATVYDCDYFSCRGYVSQSEQWGAGQRLLGYTRKGQAVTILHLGDHDPSGIDMTRDIRERLELFMMTDWYRSRRETLSTNGGAIWDDMTAHCGGRAPLTVKRIALNRDQVDEYDPPPNPAKITDSRAKAYIAEHGDESWELDALEPSVLTALIQDEIAALIEDQDAWDDRKAYQERGRDLLTQAADRWDDVADYLERPA